MDKIKELEEKIKPILDKDNIKLYSLKWISGKENILQVAIMRKDGSMDLDTCAMVSEAVSELLDNSDFTNDTYTLEVCSPGAERDIQDINELYEMNEPYVYIRLKHPIKKKIEFTGTIEKIEDDIATLAYRDKANTRRIEFKLEDVDYIRLAVKI